MSLSLLHNFIKSCKQLKIAVVGETIVDEFIQVVYEGQSMKSFCPVFRDTLSPVIRQEGGAMAIYNHIKNFTGHVDFFSNPKDTIIKTRFIDAHDGKKHIEWNKFDTRNYPDISIDCAKYDAVILADFGHGLSEHIQINDGFYLMCQTNSNNFGFNRLSKWKSFAKKGVCVDLREASLQINKRIDTCTDEDAFQIFNYELNTAGLYITLGASGSLYTDGEKVYRYPCFKTNIVDTIGAGDTFFAFSVLADALNLPVEQRLYIASLAASLSTTWLCNEFSVTPQSLLEHANQYL
ncbi:MAG: PfkB family carbohydrate kinase [Bacteroidia bacterium]|nr:PfkB family carbohydrate kinase [Bacteroidia bacterium]